MFLKKYFLKYSFYLLFFLTAFGCATLNNDKNNPAINADNIERLIPLKNSFYYGGFFDYSFLNFNNVQLKTSCDMLANDQSKPFVGGLFWGDNSFFSEDFGIQFRFGAKYKSGVLSGTISKFKIPFIVNDSIIYGKIDEESHYTMLGGQLGVLPTLQLENYFENSFLKTLKIKSGLVAEYNFYYTQADSQRAISPENLLFPNERRTQEYAASSLYFNTPFQLNLLLGLELFKIPLSSQLSFSLTSSFTQQLWSYNSENTWITGNLQVGFAINYSPEKYDTIYKAPIKIDSTPPPIPNLVSAISTIPDTVSVRIEEYDSVETLPLLNQIFFQQNSNKVLPNYILYSKDSVKYFTTKITGSALDVYYNYLNIVATRMRNIPSATLEISGYCNGLEKDKKISSERANFVKNYLVNNWGISANRIKTSFGLLPPNPSSEQTQEGTEENSRVEIESDDPRITIPFVRRYIHQKANPPSVVFKPFVETEAGLRDWKIVIMEDTLLWKEIRTKDSVPQEIEWNWRNDENKFPSFPLSFSYYLKVTDNTGRSVLSKVSTIKVAYDSLQFKLENNRNDTLIENYSLLLFDYDSPKISESDKLLLKAIANRIGAKASVTITGYTDSLGTEEHNKTLAIARAKESANFLKSNVPKSVTIIINEDKCGEYQRFNYAIPEGRSHCRTVIIDVRTPVVRNKK